MFTGPGAGGGLDSDKLDGYHYQSFLLSGGTAQTALSASDSDKLDGYHYQSFLLSGGTAQTALSASDADTLDTYHAISFPLLAGREGGQTLTNTRITPRITTIESHATPTINTDNCDAVTITAQAEAITSMTTNLSGAPVNFQKLIVRIKDNGTAREIAWGASFVAKGVALPTTTVISKLLTVGFIYDTVATTWGCVASVHEA